MEFYQESGKHYSAVYDLYLVYFQLRLRKRRLHHAGRIAAKRKLPGESGLCDCTAVCTAGLGRLAGIRCRNYRSGRKGKCRGYLWYPVRLCRSGRGWIRNLGNAGSKLHGCSSILVPGIQSAVRTMLCRDRCDQA